MSQLQKAIGRVQRREGPRAIGFGFSSREQPRAMLVGMVAADQAGVSRALDAGADFVIVHAEMAEAAAQAVKASTAKDRCIGALVDSLDEAGAQALKDAGADFAISSLEGTAATAFDPDRLGHVISASPALEDNTLRALGPLSLDGLYVDLPGGAMSIADQLHLVRLSSFSGAPLLVAIEATASTPELRVLRDSGAAAVVVPPATTASQLGALIEALKAVPAPRKIRREGGDIALVPAVSRREEEEDDDEDDD